MGMAPVLNPAFVIVHAYMFADKYVNPPVELFDITPGFRINI